MFWYKSVKRKGTCHLLYFIKKGITTKKWRITGLKPFKANSTNAKQRSLFQETDARKGQVQPPLASIFTNLSPKWSSSLDDYKRKKGFLKHDMFIVIHHQI